MSTNPGLHPIDPAHPIGFPVHKSVRAGASGLDRRDFIRLLGASGLAAATWRPWQMAMAGPFEAEEWNQFIPADKKLRPEWVQSLFARGTPTTCVKSRNELRYLGMPVGGIGCGTLYLAGDGRLWNWDLFNQNAEGVFSSRKVTWDELGMNFPTGDQALRPREGKSYARPALPADSQSIAQGFALRVRRGDHAETRALDAPSWAEVSFTGQYPIGIVEYTDPGSPVTATLEAFSPFIPHNADDSGLPATVFHFTVTNHSDTEATVQLAGWLQNATSFHSAKAADGERVNRVQRGGQIALIAMEFQPAGAATGTARPDLLVEDFEHGYGAWNVEGTAFGTQPARRADIPSYQGELGGLGDKVVNSHASAPGRDVSERDNATGRLTSRPFPLQRRFLSFYLGGGRRPEVGVRLLVDGKVVRTVSGQDGNAMRLTTMEIAEFEGREAVLEIFDEAKGGWGNVGVDHIVQTDVPKTEVPLEQKPDFGTMALGLIGDRPDAALNPEIARAELPASAFARNEAGTARGPSPIGSVTCEWTLAPGQSAEARFVLAWHFPRTVLPVPDAKSGNYYARRFRDATAVASYVAAELPRLELQTRLWRDTWYDSTLPHWFLERTFANTSTLATSTAHRFATGRFWGWEGIGCCEGTCTHVWHYAQAMGRLFPELERDLRERVDFGVSFHADTGVIGYRGEGTGPAVDGQCGRILGVWREHQMSVDGAFLQRVWPRVKSAAEYLLRHDVDGDGILDGAQENTLDAAWYGQIAWLTSLSLAALRATEEMAREQSDPAFAERCRAQYEKGRAAVERKLFNGEYFIQLADPKHARSLGTYAACHIDQVHGQSWAWQVNLGRVLDRAQTLSALQSLWKYNFALDVGPFRRKFTAGRPYALAGDAGLVMTSNPKLIPNVYGTPSWQIGYFNECMSGFEHQVASHMIAEGMVEEGLAVTRAIHDRYHAARRNPFNEVECSDHYARAMASYGTFVSACGFESHGPRGHIGFAPRLTPDNFRAAFTAAGGWGTFAQQMNSKRASAQLHLKWGRLRLKTFSLAAPPHSAFASVQARLDNQSVAATLAREGERLRITFATMLELAANQSLVIVLT